MRCGGLPSIAAVGDVLEAAAAGTGDTAGAVLGAGPSLGADLGTRPSLGAEPGAAFSDEECRAADTGGEFWPPLDADLGAGF